jgi:hypothetical protein
MIDKQDLCAAIDLIEAVAPNAAVKYGTIPNEVHVLHPFGRGVFISIDTGKIRVWEKGSTFVEAAQRVIRRMNVRNSEFFFEIVIR